MKKAKAEGDKANGYLVGHIKEEYHINKFTKNFVNFLLRCAWSEEPKKHIDKVTCLSENRPIYLHTLWVNYMKKYEFNPPHNHSGVLSFIIFVKIPYDLKEEAKQFIMREKDGNFTHTSKLAFLNTLP